MAHELGLLKLRERVYHPAVGCQFFVGLSQSGGGSGMSDDELRRAAEEEQLASLLERFNLLPGRVSAAVADAPGGEAIGGVVVNQLRMLLGGPDMATKVDHSLDTESRLRMLETEVAALRRSRSWRLTAPLRAAAKMARRALG